MDFATACVRMARVGRRLLALDGAHICRVAGARGLATAMLRFRFHLPDAIMDQHRRVWLTAQIGDVRLPCSEYDAPGEHLYICEIPEHLWTNGSVLIRFELDKAGAPAPPDLRELGLQVLFVECSGSLKRCLGPFVLSQES